jgi:hypothetical protein
MKMKKIWKDRDGVGGIALAIVAVIAIVALLAVGYMALGMGDGTDGPPQGDQDLNGDGVPDPIVGNVHINVKVKILNPDYNLGKDDDVQYTIDKVTTTLEDEAPSMSIWDGFEIWSGSDNLKLVCTLKFPAYNEVLIKNAAEEWEQDYKGTGTSWGDVISYAYQDFYSGSVRYHGSYNVDLTLYKYDGGEWVQCDHHVENVSL